MTHDATIRRRAKAAEYAAMKRYQRSRWRTKLAIELSCSVQEVSDALRDLTPRAGAPRLPRCPTCGRPMPKKKETTP